MPNDFTHLRTHNVYSFGEGLGSSKKYAEEVIRNKQSALAITNNGNLCGLYEFYKVCKSSNIKFIAGQEFYVAQNDDAGIKDSSNSRYDRLVILAKNDTGLKNLSRLSSLSWTKYFYYKPKIDSKLLNKYKEGLIVLAAGIDGVVGAKWAQGEEKKALGVARTYKAIMGEDFYLEASPEYSRQQIGYNNFLVELRQVDKYKIVATNNVYYPKQEQAKYYPYLVMIKNNMKQVEFGREQKFPSNSYLMSRAEMYEGFEKQGFEEKKINRWLDNSLLIKDCIEDLTFKTTFEVPNFMDFKDKVREVEVKEKAVNLFD
jgi:DNA polymerase-3 subunit alpha